MRGQSILPHVTMDAHTSLDTRSAVLTLSRKRTFSTNSCRGWIYYELIFAELLTFVVEVLLVMRREPSQHDIQRGSLICILQCMSYTGGTRSSSPSWSSASPQRSPSWPLCWASVSLNCRFALTASSVAQRAYSCYSGESSTSRALIHSVNHLSVSQAFVAHLRDIPFRPHAI